MLNQQVNLQREKIRDLEAILESRRNSPPAGMAQELADLQHKCLALERDKLEAERRLRHSNVWQTCRGKTMLEYPFQSELERLSEQPQPQQQQQPPHQNGNGRAVSQAELERLQLAVQRLMADNEQKASDHPSVPLFFWIFLPFFDNSF